MQPLLVQVVNGHMLGLHEDAIPQAFAGAWLSVAHPPNKAAEVEGHHHRIATASTFVALDPRAESDAATCRPRSSLGDRGLVERERRPHDTPVGLHHI